MIHIEVEDNPEEEEEEEEESENEEQEGDREGNYKLSEESWRHKDQQRC
jgi:translation initiation factor 5B